MPREISLTRERADLTLTLLGARIPRIKEYSYNPYSTTDITLDKVLNRCSICKLPVTSDLAQWKAGKGTSRLVWDHDHLTGEFRGWLCDGCNLGLGIFHDEITWLNNAIKYLSKTDSKYKYFFTN